MRKSPAILLFLLLCSGLARAGDEALINQGLKDNAGGTYILPAGTYNIAEQIVMPENTVLSGTPNSDGTPGTALVFQKNLGLHKGIVQGSSGSTVQYIDFDGNKDNIDYPFWNGANGKGNPSKNGQGNGDAITVKRVDGFKVLHCNFRDNAGDGLRAEYSKNIEFAYNTGSNGGHDLCYTIKSERVNIHDNYLNPSCNSAIRALSVSHLRIFNNTIPYIEVDDGAGPSIQVQNDGGQMIDVEIYNNVIYDSWGPAFWIVSKTGDSEELNLHHNVIYRAGGKNLNWAVGICASGYDNANIHNNVFDGSNRAAIFYYAVSSSWATSASSQLDSNIFVDTSGIGVVKDINAQDISFRDNCFYGNSAGDTSDCAKSSSDIEINPRTTSTPSGYTWDGSKWICPEVPFSPMGNATGIYDNEPELTDEQLQEYEFNSIFDILNLDFSDNGTLISANVRPDIHEEEKGKSKAWIDIVGWNNLTERNGVFYVPEGEQPIIKYEVENTARRPVSTATSITYETHGSSENNSKTLQTDLKVTSVYEVAKPTTKKINGLLIPSVKWIRKSQTSHYYDSEPIPETFKPAINTTAYVTILNSSRGSQTRVYVPESLDVMQVLFRFNSTETTHYLHAGTINATTKGVKYTQISDLDYWEGDNVSRVGNTLILSGAMEPEKVESELQIIQYDVYGRKIPITDFQIFVNKQDEKKLISPSTFLFTGVVGIFIIAIKQVLGGFL